MVHHFLYQLTHFIQIMDRWTGCFANGMKMVTIHHNQFSKRVEIMVNECFCCFCNTCFYKCGCTFLEIIILIIDNIIISMLFHTLVTHPFHYKIFHSIPFHSIPFHSFSLLTFISSLVSIHRFIPSVLPTFFGTPAVTQMATRREGQ